MTDYLRLVEVLAMHDRLLEEFGGPRGVRDPGGLESALFRPQTGYYPDIFAEATALLESLLVNHPFVDGDKRTAFAATDVFLRLNGIRLRVDAAEAHAFLVGVLSTDGDRFTTLEAWLRAHESPS